MKTAVWLAAALIFGLTGEATAQAANDTRPACPARQQGEAKKPYIARTHSYCETRWSELLVDRQTGGRTHDEFINGCTRKCSGDLADKQAGNNLALYVAGGALLLGGAAAAALGGKGSGDPPASP
jgi:hypothetical protein